MRARRIGGDERGGVAVVFALALVPVLAAAGAAIDYSRASSARAGLQNAVDAAVLAGLKVPANRRASTADAVLKERLPALGAELDQASFGPTAAGGLRGRVKVRLRSVFGRLFAADGIAVSALSEGALRPRAAANEAGSACVLLLDPSAPEALRLEAGAVLSAPSCEVHVETRATVAAHLARGSVLDSRRACLRGSGLIASGGRAGAVETACRTVPDPHRDALPAPADVPCQARRPAPRSGPLELEPGAHCGGIAVEPGRTVVLKPGFHVIRDGSLSLGAGTTLKGAGVTLFLADARSGLHVAPGGRIELSAPTAGPHAGVLLFEPAGLPRSTLALHATRGQELQGLVHLPSRTLVLGARSTGPGDRAAFVLNALALAEGTDWRLAPGPKAIPVKNPADAGEAEIVLRY